MGQDLLEIKDTSKRTAIQKLLISKSIEKWDWLEIEEDKLQIKLTLRDPTDATSQLNKTCNQFQNMTWHRRQELVVLTIWQK